MSMPPDQIMTEADVAAIYSRISNWGRWGESDERGTLNLIDQAAIRRGLASTSEGVSLALGLPIEMHPPIDRNRYPVQRFLFRAGDQVPERGFGSTWEQIGLVPHGISHTHLDAFSHAFQNRVMYNGRNASEILSTGATVNAITAFGGQVTSRALLFDIPRYIEVDYLEPDRPVYRHELEGIEKRAGTLAAPGDIVFVRTGRHARYRKYGGGSEQKDGRSHLSGLYPDVLPWLHERGVAVLGSDGVNEHLAFKYGADDHPIHIGCLVHMGLPLLHSANLDELATRLDRSRKIDFLCSIGLLSIEGATSSPVNPVAIL